jgi:hypothetical protein
VRRPLSLLLVLLAATVAGCGEERAKPPRKPVVLTLSAPQDGATTREDTVQVGGSVTPASARVLVRGERATVSGGRFSAAVDLREGTNVIDVGAAAPGWRASWRALRVTRHSRIRLPDVLGRETVDAVGVLEARGFDVRVTNDDGLLDAFRDRPRVVCLTDPEPGTPLLPGSEVEVVVSKTC